MSERRVDYDAVAPTYDDRYRRNDYAGIEAALLDFLGPDPSIDLLDVGCGTGHWMETLARRCRLAAGVDPSREMLARARAAAPAGALARGRAERLPWRAASFDRVFVVNALHHFDDPLAALGEARRVLRPGGRLLTVGLDPHTGLDRWWIYDWFPEARSLDLLRYLSCEEIRRMMRAAGLAECRSWVAQHMPAQIPVREAIARGILEPGTTSQLAILTEAEYRKGRDSLEGEMLRREARGESMMLSADLRLYATTARAGGTPGRPRLGGARRK
jgi:SAM-dependent methyltransferase